jgi:hypothetical protein
MKQINLLPTPTWVEKYRLLLSILATVCLTSAAVYWAFPFLRQAWYIYTNKSSSVPSNAVVQCSNYSIVQLKALGYFMKKAAEDRWGLLQSPDGQIATVTLGDYVGYEKAQVIDIHTNGISLKLSNKKKPFLIAIKQSVRE